MVPLQISLVDLTLLRRSFIPTCMGCYIQEEGWCDGLIILLMPLETLSRKLLPLNERIKFSHSQGFQNAIAKKDYFVLFSRNDFTES